MLHQLATTMKQQSKADTLFVLLLLNSWRDELTSDYGSASDTPNFIFQSHRIFKLKSLDDFCCSVSELSEWMIINTTVKV